MLLTSISTSYQHLVPILCWGKETLKFKENSRVLKDHYHHKQNSGKSSDEGLMIKGNQDYGREKDKNNGSTRGHSISKSKSKIVK